MTDTHSTGGGQGFSTTQLATVRRDAVLANDSQHRRHSSPHRALPSLPTSDLIADAPQRRQQLFLNGVKEAIDRRRLAPKIAAPASGMGVIQTS